MKKKYISLIYKLLICTVLAVIDSQSFMLLTWPSKTSLFIWEEDTRLFPSCWVGVFSVVRLLNLKPDSHLKLMNILSKNTSDCLKSTSNVHIATVDFIDVPSGKNNIEKVDKNKMARTVSRFPKLGKKIYETLLTSQVEVS